MALKKTTTTLAPAVPAAKEKDKLKGSAELAQTVDRFIEAKITMEDAAAALAVAQADLTEDAFNVWLANRGSAGTVVYTGVSGAQMNVSCKDQYSALSEDALPQVVQIVGENVADQLFSYEETMKADLAKVPEDQRADFIARVQQVAKDMGVDPSVLSMVQRPRPIKGVFHTQRHTLLSPAQNRALQPVVKTVISCTVKADSLKAAEESLRKLKTATAPVSLAPNSLKAAS